MTARESTLGPSAVAESAAEAVRTLNHLTLYPPSAEVPGWEDVSDVYRVLGELRLLVERVPQVLRQVAKHLEQSASSYEVDAAALGRWFRRIDHWLDCADFDVLRLLTLWCG